MTTIHNDAGTGGLPSGQQEALLKGLPPRTMRSDWSAAERDWLESQHPIVNAMRRELTIAAGAYHSLYALQWPSVGIVDDVAARLPQFQRVVSVIGPANRAAHRETAQDTRLTTLVTDPLAWLLKQPREGRMFLLLNPDALLTRLISSGPLLRAKAQCGACAYALVSAGEIRSAFATALGDEGHELRWEQSVQGHDQRWHRVCQIFCV